jgi:DNA-binding transcriptional regulator YiaG
VKTIDPAEVMRKRRAELGLTQGELAEQLGVTERAVQYWEGGQRPVSASILKLLETLKPEGEQ